jgi:hypothetical protein
MDRIFGFITIASGLYCFYAAFQMKATKQLTQSVFFTKDLEQKQCKDKEGYIKESIRLMLITGGVTSVYGVFDLMNEMFLKLGYWFGISIVIFIGFIIWAALKGKKMNQKYF